MTIGIDVFNASMNAIVKELKALNKSMKQKNDLLLQQLKNEVEQAWQGDKLSLSGKADLEKNYANWEQNEGCLHQ